LMHDSGPVFEGFAGFPAVTEGGGQHHSAAHAPAPETSRWSGPRPNRATVTPGLNRPPRSL
jgi:hypothetical protein